MSFLDKILNNNKKEEKEEGFFFNKKKQEKQASQLEELIKNGSVESIKEEITSENIDEKDENSFYALNYAILHKKEELVRYFFSLGSKVDCIKNIIKTKNTNILNIFLEYRIVLPRFIEEKPLLHFALEENTNLDFLKLLLQKGCLLVDYEEKTSLQKALDENCDFEVVMYLIELDGSCLNIFNEEKNLLEDIVLSSLDNMKKVRVIKELKTKKHIDLNKKTKDNKQTILELAVKQKQTFLIKELILLGADFSSIKHKLNTLFEKGDIEDIIESVNLKDMDLVDFCSFLRFEKINEYFQNCSTLENTLAILNIIDNPKLKNEEKIYLITQANSKGANVNEIDDSRDTTALLNYCKQITSNTDIKLLELLLSFGAKIEICSKSAFFYTLKNYNLDLIDLLLKEKANVNFIDYENKTLANYILDDNKILEDDYKVIEILKKAINSNLDLNTKNSYVIKGKDCSVDMFSMFLVHNRQYVVKFILDENLIINCSSDYIYYAIRFLKSFELQKRIIAIDPLCKYYDFYEENEKTDYAQALGIAMELSNEYLCNYLLETYENIKSHSEIKEIYLDLVEKNFKLETIKKLILRDSNINRKYNYISHSTTLLFSCAKRFVDEKYNKTDKYFELLKFLLENGADANIQEEYLTKQKDSSTIFTATAKDYVNEKLFDLLLEYKADPKEKTTNMYSSSILSIIYNGYDLNDEVLISYLEYFDKKVGIDLEDSDKNKTTLLLAACMNCKAKTVKWLIEKGANIHLTGGFDNGTPLYKTISNYPNAKAIDRMKTVEVLIDAGANIEELSQEMTPLMTACYYGAFLCVELLLKKGAKVNALNKVYANAVNYTVYGEYSYDYNYNFEHMKARILELLNQYNANFDNIPENNESSLMCAIRTNRREIFDSLIKYHANINLQNKNKLNAFMYAISSGSIYFVNKLLKEETLDINMLDSINANALFYTLVRQNKNEAKSIFEQLVEKGIEETIFEENQTLLHKACDVGNFELLPTILNFTKYDINTQDKYGAPAILNVVLSTLGIYEFEKIKIIKYLVEQGAKLNIKDKEDKHILICALNLNEKALVQTLLELGSDINITTKEGKTVFHILLDLNLSANEINNYLQLFNSYNANINFNTNIDSALLYFVRNMEFVSNRSMGFLSNENKAKKEEDEIVDVLIKNGADINLTLDEAKEKNISNNILKYLEEKANNEAL